MRLALITLLAGFATAVCLAAGGYYAHYQHRAMTQFLPTPAKVVHADTQWSHSDRYAVVIEYEYQADGATHTAHDFAPLTVLGDGAWAHAMAQQYAPASTVTAFVDPADASHAFLHRQTRFDPYVFLLLPALLVAIYFHALARGGFFQGVPVARLATPTTWYELSPQQPPAGQLGWALALAALWYGYGATVGFHYASVAEAPSHHLALTALAVYALLGAGLLRGVIRSLRTAWRLPAPQVCGTLSPFPADGPVIVRVEQDFPDGATVRALSITLACLQRRGLSSECVFTRTHTFARHQEVPAGTRVTAEHRFDLPKGARRASSLGSRWDYPRFDWQLEVTVELTRGPACHWVFPVLLSESTTSPAGTPAPLPALAG